MRGAHHIGRTSEKVHNSKYYVKGRSYLLPGVDAQELVDRYHGTGVARLNRAGDKWINKEFIVADRDIGVNVNHVTGEETITNRFTIHYNRGVVLIKDLQEKIYDIMVLMKPKDVTVEKLVGEMCIQN